MKKHKEAVTDGSDLTHDGHLRFVEIVGLPVEEVDDIAILWDYVVGLVADVEGFCPRSTGFAVANDGGEEGIGALTLYIDQVGKCQWDRLHWPVATAVL